MTLEWRQGGQAWQRAERREEARTARAEEKRRREADKRRTAEERLAAELREQSGIGRATKATSEVEQRVQKLTNLLAAAVADPVSPLDFEQLKKKPKLPKLDLGTDAEAEPPPEWRDFVPHTSPLHKLLLRQRYAEEKRAAGHAFTQAVAHHEERERARLARVAAATQAHDEARDQATRQVAPINREVDEFRGSVLARDRHAGARYFQKVLEKIKDARRFCGLRRVAYVPESSLVVVEWSVPKVEIVPQEKEYRYSPDLDEAVVHRRRSSAEIRQIYHTMLAQMAVRAARFVFGSDPQALADTVVFNGVAEDIGPETGRSSRPCLFTMRAIRPKFERLRLPDIDAVECVRKHFGARLSAHPEDLSEVPAIVPFDRVDPAALEPTGTVIDDDPRPDLHQLSGERLTAFLTALFDRAGWDCEGFDIDRDGRLHGVVVDPAIGVGGRFHVHYRPGTSLVSHAEVRRLAHGVQHDHATRGLLLSLGGFSAQSQEYANSHRVDLYDGHQLLGLCHAHDVPARIGALANVCPATGGVPEQRGTSTPTAEAATTEAVPPTESHEPPPTAVGSP